MLREIKKLVDKYNGTCRHVDKRSNKLEHDGLPAIVSEACCSECAATVVTTCAAAVMLMPLLAVDFVNTCIYVHTLICEICVI